MWVFFHCLFSVNKPTKSFQRPIQPNMKHDDVTSLILCLFIVLGLFSMQYSPGPPSSADQQYVTLWPTNTIYNILRCIMQYSGQQYAIFWPTTIVYAISWTTYTMCNILTNNYNMQFCTLDIPPLSLFLHHAYRSNLHEFMKVKHGQPLELVYKPCNTFWPQRNRKLTSTW